MKVVELDLGNWRKGKVEGRKKKRVPLPHPPNLHLLSISDKQYYFIVMIYGRMILLLLN